MKRTIIVTACIVLACSSYIFPCLGDEPADQQTDAGGNDGDNRISGLETIYLKLIAEPNENAFWLLAPHGWKVEGGIISVGKLKLMGLASQATEPKIDFTIKSDDSGSIMLSWLPDIIYYDRSKELMGAGQCMSPVEFLKKIVLPFKHFQASDIKIIEEIEEIPLVTEKYSNLFKALQLSQILVCRSGMLTISYIENGVLYKEKLITGIKDFKSSGLWGNSDTFIFRAPADRFQQMEPLAKSMCFSMELKKDWVMKEIKRLIDGRSLELKENSDIEKLCNAIMEWEKWIYREMADAMLPNGGSFCEYYNPITERIEIGNEKWKRRWVNNRGDVVYTDDTDYDPNDDLGTDDIIFVLSEEDDWIYDFFLPFW